MGTQDFLLDKRIVRRSLDKGLVSEKEFDKHLNALPDRADNAVVASIDELVGDDDDDAED